jgi:hypothetical protein
MRALMGLIKDRYGTYYAQRKVPERLQEAVARVLNAGRDRQVHLKKSLGTKSLKLANVAATHVLAHFDRTLADAEALLKERPVMSSITDAQIKRMAESYYASMLANDEEARREGTDSEPLFQSVAKQLSDAGIEYQTPFAVGELPEAGLSDREIYKRKDTLDYELSIIPNALARGDVTVIREELDELDRVCDPLITYKGSLSEKKFGKPVTYYITAKARRPQPRLRDPQHPGNPKDKANVGRRYARWKERLQLDHRATPEPRGVLAASAMPETQKENLDRTERLLMVLLQADPTKVKAARKLRGEWAWHRARLYDWRPRSRASIGTLATSRRPTSTPSEVP